MAQRPVADRLVALAGLALTGAWAAQQGLAHAGAGYRWTGALAAAALAPLALYFLAVAAAPRLAARALTFRAPFDPARLAHVAAGALVVFTLCAVALQPLAGLALRLEGGDVGLPRSGAEVLLGTSLLAALSVGSAFAWVAVVEDRPMPLRAARALGLWASPPLRTVGWGLGLGVASLALSGAVIALWARLTGAMPESDVARYLAGLLGLGGILAATALAAVHEEVFFRGLLLQRIGLLPHAVLFALGHAAYGTAVQVLIPFLLALLWGWATRRTGSLWVAILAHGLFNLVGFLAAAGYLGA